MPINIQENATPGLELMRANVTPHRLAAEIGPRVTRLVQRNFLKKERAGNSMGWPSQHFYARAAEATNWQEGFGFVMISVNQIGVRQRLIGGVIKPVNAKMLTMPATADAYGKRAGEFSNLKFGFALDPESGKMRPALVEKEGTVSGADTSHKWVRDSKTGKYKEIITKAKKGKALATGKIAIFWLLASANQKPDPTVMPSDDEFQGAMDESVDTLLRHPTLTN